MKPNKFIYHAKQPSTVTQREQVYEDMTGSPTSEPVYYFLAVSAIGAFCINHYGDAYAHPYTKDDTRRVRRFQRLRQRFYSLSQKGEIPLGICAP